MYDMRVAHKKSKQAGSVRRSIVLPRVLLEEAMKAAPGDLRTNFNRLIRTVLEEFLARAREQRFSASMAEMAADPEIRRVNKQIGEEFRAAEEDGLPS
jgi:hypothetical protein